MRPVAVEFCRVALLQADFIHKKKLLNVRRGESSPGIGLQDSEKKLGVLAGRILFWKGLGSVPSQGHTQMTALSHYLGLPFALGDKGAMLEYVSGWA